MRVSKITLAGALTVLAFRVCVLIAATAEDATATSPAYTNALKASVVYEGGPDLIPTYITYINFGTNKFGFALPENFRLQNTSPDRLTLVSADLNSLINWRIVGPSPTNDVPLDPAVFKEMLMQRHPGGKILAEFSQKAGGKIGPAFEMRWSGEGALERMELAIFVASPAGIIEFDLVSSLEKYGSARQKMNKALLSLRWNDEQGKLTMPVFSNKL